MGACWPPSHFCCSPSWDAILAFRSVQQVVSVLPGTAENEARAFAKSEGWETEDVEEIALRVRWAVREFL